MFNVSALANTTLLACLSSGVSSSSCPPAYPVPTRRGANGGITSCSTANSVCPSGSLRLVDAASKTVECRLGAVACPAAYPVAIKLGDSDPEPVYCAVRTNYKCPPPLDPSVTPVSLSVYDAQYNLVQCWIFQSKCPSTFPTQLVNLSPTPRVLEGCAANTTACPPAYPVKQDPTTCAANAPPTPSPTPSPPPVRAACIPSRGPLNRAGSQTPLSP